MPRGGKNMGKGLSRNSAFGRASTSASGSSSKTQEVSTTVVSVLSELKSLALQIQVSNPKLVSCFVVHIKPS